MAQVRDFFVRRNVLEVETPVLSAYGGTDPQLDYFEIEDPKRFMMTSPEFHMKRLLAAKFGDIFQITKSFRKDEFGGHHNNEFSMVEWYRVGMPQDKLMDEVEDLVSEIIGTKLNARRTRWIDAFKNYAGVNPFCEKLSDFAILGRYVLTPSIFDILEQTPPGRNNEIQLTDGMRTLCHREKMCAVDFEGRRYDTGNLKGYLEAIIDFALKNEEAGDWLHQFILDKAKSFEA